MVSAQVEQQVRVEHRPVTAAQADLRPVTVGADLRQVPLVRVALRQVTVVAALVALRQVPLVRVGLRLVMVVAAR